MKLIQMLSTVINKNRNFNIPFGKVMLFILLAFTMYASMVSNILPKHMDVSMYDKATEHIWAEYTIEDIEKTEAKRNIAAEAVPDQYTLMEHYQDIQIKKLIAFFEAAKIVRVDYEQAEFGTLADFVLKLQTTIENDIHLNLSTRTIQTIINTPLDQIQLSQENATAVVNDVMSLEIKRDDVESAKQDVKNKLLSTSLSDELREAITEVAQFVITPNYLFDAEKTAIERQKQRDAVDVVFIREGQLLVEKGQVIDEEIYRQLKLVGILDKQSNILPYIGLVLLVSFLTYVIIYFYNTEKKVHPLGLYTLIFFLSFVLMKITSIIAYNSEIVFSYIVPIAMGTMLIKILLSERLALITAVVFAICGSIIFNPLVTGTFNFTQGIYILCSSLAGIVFLSPRNPKAHIIKATIFITGVNIGLALIFAFMKNGQTILLELGGSLTSALLSGPIAAVLTIGLLPYLEAGFGILSSMKLIELSNPNHPLFRKLLTEAPGTYHHSIMVANLAESACEAIGANGLLARVGSFYHDLGKTKWPQYFIENQMNMENPHDSISPKLSTSIITAHPLDGANMLRKHKMPLEIIQIAEQHHGKSLLKFFYYKAKEQDETVCEEDFRYPGPKPQGKEAAVICIADSIEAAVRSLANPTTNEIEILVRNIIRDKLEDGQFDECDISMKELDIVAKTLYEQLKGIFHSRIEYPNDLKKKVTHI
jgi:cyclic-di-AMP phosphodiesterase PgpH